MQELYREIPQHEIKPQQIDNQYALRQPLVSSGFSWSGAYAGTYLTVKTPLGEEKTNGRIPLDDEALQQTEQDILEKLAAQHRDLTKAGKPSKELSALETILEITPATPSS
ncbi:MAG TPA: hypothetical protein VJK51_00360 [Candidatus Nanoarchaeia archaeon]|nr:hypothetical protein [Candidatus Nanoarchaeia archaeon]